MVQNNISAKTMISCENSLSWELNSCLISFRSYECSYWALMAFFEKKFRFRFWIFVKIEMFTKIRVNSAKQIQISIKRVHNTLLLPIFIPCIVFYVIFQRKDKSYKLFYCNPNTSFGRWNNFTLQLMRVL